MARWDLSAQERRLANFCRVLAGLFFIGAVAFLFYGETFAAALLASMGTSGLVTAAHPREGRNAMLPVLVGLLVCGVLALFHRQWIVGGVSAGVFLISLFVYRSASPGVHSAPAREGPPPLPETAPPVKLGVKS
jgi:hypothetical protein